jgi:hypothetical protein
VGTSTIESEVTAVMKEHVRERFAVITTRDRPDDYRDCVEAIAPQVDAVFTVCHVPGPGPAPAYITKMLSFEETLFYSERLPNISAMWNLGLDAVAFRARSMYYDVALLNDDAIVPPEWFHNVTQAMRWYGAAAGAVQQRNDPRMAGFAFILDGKQELRADEQFQWWYGDTDIARRAERLGGLALAPGREVEHRHPNSTTVGELAEIAAEDHKRYRRKWHAR